MEEGTTTEEEYHVVIRDGKPYLRKVPFTYKNPSPTQQATRAVFGVAAYKSRDQWGKTKVTAKDGQEKDVVHAAKAVQDRMKDVKIVAPRPKPPMAYKFLGMDLEQYVALIEALRVLAR